MTASNLPQAERWHVCICSRPMLHGNEVAILNIVEERSCTVQCMRRNVVNASCSHTIQALCVSDIATLHCNPLCKSSGSNAIAQKLWRLGMRGSCAELPAAVFHLYSGLVFNWSGLMRTSLQEKVHVLLICIPTAAAMTPVCCRPMGGQKAVYLACSLQAPQP